MKRIIRRILFMLACAIVISAAYFELAHRYNFGHFVSYGLHVDVISRDSWIGIPGQTKMYSAELSNFSLWPAKLEACDYITDAFDKGTEYPYAVQRWDNASGNWQTIVEQPDRESFCHPVPLSKAKTDLISRRLWPGMYVEVMSGEATGAREPFRKGDRARFVVFSKLDSGSAYAVPSHEFIIEDDVQRGDTPLRVQH